MSEPIIVDGVEGLGMPIDASLRMKAADANDLMCSISQCLDLAGTPTGDGYEMQMSARMKRRLERAIRTLGFGAGFDENPETDTEYFKKASISKEFLPTAAVSEIIFRPLKQGLNAVKLININTPAD